jgi:hypothetical protein
MLSIIMSELFMSTKAITSRCILDSFDIFRVGYLSLWINCMIIEKTNPSIVNFYCKTL